MFRLILLSIISLLKFFSPEERRVFQRVWVNICSIKSNLKLQRLINDNRVVFNEFSLILTKVEVIKGGNSIAVTCMFTLSIGVTCLVDYVAIVDHNLYFLYFEFTDEEGDVLTTCRYNNQHLQRESPQCNVSRPNADVFLYEMRRDADGFQTLWQYFHSSGSDRFVSCFLICLCFVINSE